MDESASEILLPVSPEEAWEAITDPERLGEWLGEAAELELEPGGVLAIELEDGGPRHGFFEEVEEPRRLVFWWSADDAEASRVEIELEPAPAGTRIRVVESRPLAVLDARGVELPWLGGEAGDATAGPQLAARALSAVG